MLGLTAANNVLGALLLQNINGDKVDNFELLALSEKTLEVGNVGVDRQSSLLDRFLGLLGVAAVDLGVVATALILVEHLLLVLLGLAGYMARAGDGESSESEDNDLGVHVDWLVVMWKEV